eukprot:CAMPEP_0194165740 /NCGR_PEP_ID=MMETSP0154-20130528/1573_1 /TAXON_ID=1049557 /ORGANISM="Thalassiothrix antarctica, Strain L6-D1" /LENGTH=832 /DNA_ID=CAMNT_0038876259 /DNA_START=84 /DNA_END=2582 /DNA_ORIENTATION=-
MSLSGTGRFGVPQTTNWGIGSAPWYCPEVVDSENDSNNGSLKIHNTLTGRKDVFVPMMGRTVRWYTCGPTVYDSSHVGHARTYLSLDIMRRIMTDYFRYNVIYQVNITDIDDKIILRARQNLLIDNLKKEYKNNDEDAKLRELIETAITEATDDAVSKQQKLETDLASATESRSKTELEGLLEQHQLKRSNLDKAIGDIHNIYSSTDKATTDNLINAASSVLAPKLDREKGDSVTDHQVFLDHARKYEKEFMEDMRALGVREPDVLTRVTEYLPQIIAFIAKLVERKMAYASSGSVYLSLDAFRDAGHHYRKLSGGSGSTSAAEMAEGEGALAAGGGGEKRNANDFVLWKASKPGEPAWESPWGPGRPGWHIECSVVASDILGNNMDIHSGGEDLKFPHHDNEIAQSEACGLGVCAMANGNNGSSNVANQWVNYFTHTGHLHIEGLKMSKSLKNFITIRQALEQNSSRLLRLLFLLAGGWDQPMNYSQQTMEDARSKETTFKSFFRQVEALSRNYAYYDDPVGWTNTTDDGKQNLDQDLYNSLLETQRIVHESLLDNFNTKEAMLSLLNIISDANAYLRTPKVRPAVLTLKSIAVYVTQMLKVFGVVTGNDDFGFEVGGGNEEGNSSSNSSDNHTTMIQTLASFREQVRNQALAAVKNSNNGSSTEDTIASFKSILQTCDNLRDELLPPLGVRLEDRGGDDCSMWNLEDPKDLMRELAEKKERDAAARRKKLGNQHTTKQKELTKAIDAARDPKSLFRDETLYKEWDPDTGLPTKNMDGTDVSAGQTKKKKKALDKHTKLHNDLMKKTNSNPQSLIDRLTKELETIAQQMNE